MKNVEECLKSMLNIDIEKETPRLWIWAKDGHDTYAEQCRLENDDARKFSSIVSSSHSRQPIQWSANGKLSSSTKSDELEGGEKKPQTMVLES